MSIVISLTIFPGVTPACDIAHQVTWEQGVRGGQADRMDIVRPGYWAGQLHQSHIFSVVRPVVTVRYHHLPYIARQLIWVYAIQLIPANVEDVRADIRWTERRRSIK